jgi:drug/metabolite transporter (DMT)-like permease
MLHHNNNYRRSFRLTQRRADLFLLLIAIIWGTTFTVVYTAVATFPPMGLIALRFAFAAIAFLPILLQRYRLIGAREITVGTLLGVLLFIGFATQTVGLQFTTPARAGFITGLNVALVPILSILLGQRPPLRALAGVGFALAGLVILSWGCALPWLHCAADAQVTSEQQLGDLLVLLCALAFALHIVAVSRWANTLPVLTTNTLQLIVVAVLASGLALLTERPFPVPTLGVVGAVLFLGLVATAFVFALQLRVQRYTTATHTALIFALEPVFAALFAWLWIGEAITAAVLLSGGLMLAGVIAAEVQIFGRRKATLHPAADRVVLDAET